MTGKHISNLDQLFYHTFIICIKQCIILINIETKIFILHYYRQQLIVGTYLIECGTVEY